MVSDTHLRAGRPLPAPLLAAVAGCDAVLHAGDVTEAEVLDQLAGAGAAPVARSASTSPTRMPNLKPWPLHALATSTSGRPGQGPTRNSSPGAIVYRQVSVCASGASARPGRKPRRKPRTWPT